MTSTAHSGGRRTPTVLERILEEKAREVALGQTRTSAAALLEQGRERRKQSAYRPFRQRMLDRVAAGTRDPGTFPAVIAEIKKASPSKGLIRADFDPEAIARAYERGNATCLSVLTDRTFFQGADTYLMAARSVTQLPVLRKDFIVDPWQIAESAAMGADCILLIVAALSSDQLNTLRAAAAEAELDVLVEVHDEAELQAACALQDVLIGVNNRNLHDFNVSLDTTWRLQAQMPQGVPLVTESGILSADDVATMRSRGIHAFLIGEAFMRQQDPGAALLHMMAPGPRQPADD